MFDTIWKKEFLRFLYIYPWCYMKLRSNCVLQSLTNPRKQGAHYIECYSELDLTFYEKKKKDEKQWFHCILDLWGYCLLYRSVYSPHPPTPPIHHHSPFSSSFSGIKKHRRRDDFKTTRTMCFIWRSKWMILPKVVVGLSAKYASVQKSAERELY